MMRRFVIAATVTTLGLTAYTVTAAPESTPGHLDCFDGFTGSPIDGGVRLECVIPPPATTAPTTTSAPTTSTVPPTTTTTTAPPTTTTTTTTTTSTVPPTTTTTVPPSGAQFFEDFSGNTGADRFDTHVFHRNPDIHNFWGFSGGSWPGDHDLACGGANTSRTITWNINTDDRSGSVYLCRDHMMTSMGDVDGYSIVAFSPKQTFDTVSSVSFNVNLTDLGTRQWWKVGVLSLSDCPALDIRCMYSDVGASDVSGSMATSGRLIASWSGGASAGYPGGMKIGNSQVGGSNPSPNDKATRHPVSLVDNGNGTITFRVAGATGTASGSFPACPCRVVFYDHNYTPDKSESGAPIGYSWHWDDIEVR